MNRAVLSFIEALVLILLVIAVLPLVQTPSSRSAVRSQTSPPPPLLTQGTAPWDSSLVLPTKSDRIVSYTMEVKLDTAKNIVAGTEMLEWRNMTGQPQTTFPFHLYHNAWKNNRSTFAKESGWGFSRPTMKQDDYGYTDVKAIGVYAGDTLVDIKPTFKYIQPDDGNMDDQTVFQVTIPARLANNPTVKFKIEFATKQPLPIARTGAIRDYHFLAQWFPKIGVWWNPKGTGGAWNCHQFHAHTEFFADYGVFDVRITVPKSYKVGATGGIPRDIEHNRDGTITHHFYQEDVHDFAWVASPDLEVSVRTFSHIKPEPGERLDRHHPLKEVKVILLTQPHHENMIERYFTATFNALRYFGEWYGEYPYDALTVVDPANDSRSGGMEYPTLFTAGTNMFSPKENSSPEGVTVHEFGHQFWYGMVGNNEFEEAWLDEGFNTYSTDRVIRTAWPQFKPTRYYFGGWGAGTYVGIPYVFNDVDATGLLSGNSEVRQEGKNDVMARRGWEYYQTYRLNSYTKPALSLVMLERTLGEEMMYRVMRTYHFRFRFKHPTSQDFINTVNEVTGKNYQWFFDNTWYSSDLFDYSIDNITNTKIPEPMGKFDFDTTTTAPRVRDMEYECTVVAKREGEAIAPVDVLVVFENGDQKHEQWDGAYRWKKFTYYTDSPVKYAVIDPDHKLVLDVNWNNNSKVVRASGYRSLAAEKYAAKFLFWVENYLELTSYWH